MSEPSPAQPLTPNTAGAKHRRNPWPMVVILLAVFALMIAITVLAFKALDTASKVVGAPGRIAASLAGAFQPNVTVTTLLSSTIGTMHSHPKLVVLTTQIDAEVDKASNTTWAGVNFGTTTVHVRAHGNKVQYYIPLTGLESSNFVYDDEHKTLIVRVPVPKLDEELVDVQSDPTQIDIETSNGWAKLDSFSGAPLRDEAKHDLRNAVLIAGRNELLQHEAERRGLDLLRNLLEPISDSLKPGVNLDIKFTGQ